MNQKNALNVNGLYIPHCGVIWLQEVQVRALVFTTSCLVFIRFSFVCVNAFQLQVARLLADLPPCHNVSVLGVDIRVGVVIGAWRKRNACTCIAGPSASLR